MTEPGYLDARYGRRPAHPRRVLVLAVVGVAVLVAIVGAVFAWSRSGSRIFAQVSGFHASSATSITVSFTVSKPDGQRVSCRVVAQDRYTDVVGSLDVDLPSAGTRVARTVTFPTRSLAVVGVVDSCRTLG